MITASEIIMTIPHQCLYQGIIRLLYYKQPMLNHDLEKSLEQKALLRFTSRAAKKPKMRVSGRGVLKLQRIIREKGRERNKR